MGIDTHASLLEDMFNLVVELGSLLKTLDDAASAKPKIKKIRKDDWNQRIHGFKLPILGVEGFKIKFC